MKKTINSVLLIVAVAALFGCSSAKKVAYFQNIDEIDLSQSKGLYDAHVMPKDMLSITVSTTDPKAATPFNLYGVTNNISNNSSSTYLVDNNGVIRFPVIGDVKLLGCTIRECEDIIKERIMPYMSATETPIVTVRMASFRVTVIGEVGSVGTYVAATERMSILEALAEAGDLTIYGQRDNILLIREDASGQKSAHRIDLTDANTLCSPYYYLQQNDVIYVEPNGVKKYNASIGSSAAIWLTVISTLMTITNFVINLTD